MKQQTTNNKQQTTNNKQQTTNNKKQNSKIRNGCGPVIKHTFFKSRFGKG
ncbi:hypothetical protein [Streptococcus pyogenes]|nr:hypothetical protein [Streptococcus pyogenes]HEQ0730875.1 hypothetical protein [Streptococcus pyogenes]HEQ0748153.1 hypothetical protein [Streptococcus pyogenes]HEQ1377531.1 hypothetical protein [Streptococcus pyogenes]HEQ2807904.1 hypothetical protein [Streptococcus pyogenes]HEQ3066400.1 hypothetical protein [Streptococcus pyogenes]